MKNFLLYKNRYLQEIVFFTSILIMVFFFEIVGFFRATTLMSQNIVLPLLEIQTKVVQQLYEPYRMFAFAFNKSEYVNQLEARYAGALSQLSEMDALRQENVELRILLGSTDRKIEETVIAAPIVSLAFPSVSAGSSQGVKEKDLVLSHGVLLGLIDSVSENQSKVLLLSQLKSNLIIAQTDSGVEGVIEGDGKNVLFTRIPRDAQLSVGDRITTVGQEGIEKNILIGTVRSLETRPSMAFQVAVVEQLVSFYETVIVEVK